MEALTRCFTSEEVAKRYNCSIRTVTRWVQRGEIPAINLGGRRQGPYAFRLEDLKDFERRSMVGGKKKAGGRA